jgi:hypothetical protein
MDDAERDSAIRHLYTALGQGPFSRDGLDLFNVRRLAAAIDTCTYLDTAMWDCPHFQNNWHLLETLLPTRPGGGLVLEFGVATGATVNFIAERVEGTVHGFDSFAGLPEDWRPDYPKGMFQRPTPPAVRENVNLVIGWFEDTLADFVRAHPGPVAFLHMDCDLYSSTATVLRHLRPRIAQGTIIVFDEYFNYVGWRHHEYKAFQEFVAETGLNYSYIGAVPNHQQVAVRIL